MTYHYLSGMINRCYTVLGINIKKLFPKLSLDTLYKYQAILTKEYDGFFLSAQKFSSLSFYPNNPNLLGKT